MWRATYGINVHTIRFTFGDQLPKFFYQVHYISTFVHPQYIRIKLGRNRL